MQMQIVKLTYSYCYKEHQLYNTLCGDVMVVIFMNKPLQ